MALLSNQKACLAMIFMQLLYAGMALLSKAALNKGMSYLVFVVYRQATATVALAPFAYILERGKASSLSFIVFCKIFLLSLFGLTLSMDLYYMALRHTSATFASATINLIPAITFVIAVLLRMETLNWRRIYGQCKILGVVLCASGAIVISLYQGPPLKLLQWHAQVLSPPGASSVSYPGPGEKKTPIKGPLLMFAAFISWSSWVVMQSEMLKAYPAKLSLTTLQCLLSTIQSSVIAVAVDRNRSSWILGWNMQLISVIYCEHKFLMVSQILMFGPVYEVGYSWVPFFLKMNLTFDKGVLVSGVSYCLQIWCIEKKGPVYVSMFSPLSVIITAIVSALIWSELLYFGSVLGGVLIVGGLYFVLWGKCKETRAARLENAIATSGVPKDKMVDVVSA